MEEAVQAINLLYGSTDPQQQKQADDWLVGWQQMSVSWQICDQILLLDSMPISHQFFAAQTMRTKIQFDFNELQVESYSSLRDSLMRHISKFCDAKFHAIQTQLAIALADLVIQMDTSWQNPVDSLFASFGANPDLYVTLITILKMLPEENVNHKLMTEAQKRSNNHQVLQQSTPRILQFLLTLQMSSSCFPVSCSLSCSCRKVLECFLSWVKFTSVNPEELAQNPLFLGAFVAVTQGGQLSEISTDIIVEVLRMCSQDIQRCEPVIKVCIQQLVGLREKFEKFMIQGDTAVLQEKEALQQICRIYTEAGNCLLPWIMVQSSNPEVLTILQILCQFMNLSAPEISQVPLEFWHRLASEVCRLPEQDARISHFQNIFIEVLKAAIQRCKMPVDSDPFSVDDDLTAHRQSFLMAAEDCAKVLTPNGALEHALHSLQLSSNQGIATQEAHLFILRKIGAMTEVREASMLWNLIQSLPPMISQEIQAETLEAALLHFTKKTAIELLGCMWRWVRVKPDLLQSSLNMISMMLLQTVPQNAPAHVREWIKQTQQAASVSLRDVCSGCKEDLQDLVPQFYHLYTSTMQLPIRMHLFIVEGIGSVVACLRSDEAFKKGVGELVSPLATRLQNEQSNPKVLTEILDRLTIIIRQMKVQESPVKAVVISDCIEKIIWPLTRQTMVQHSGDSIVVEKGCRLLNHSMRSASDLFKPNVFGLAQLLVAGFQQHQHSAYLYTAEVLAKTYVDDPQIVPILSDLFNGLSGTASQILSSNSGRLDQMVELVEDFYGMFEKCLRFMAKTVLEAPTLQPALELCVQALHVQQRDAMQSIVAFIELVFGLAADWADENKTWSVGGKKPMHGRIVESLVEQYSGQLTSSILQLIVKAPTQFQQDGIRRVIESVRTAVGKEQFQSLIERSMGYLPQSSITSRTEWCTFRQQFVGGDSSQVTNAVQDLSYRCEQIIVRNRGEIKQTASTEVSCRAGECNDAQCVKARCRAT